MKKNLIALIIVFCCLQIAGCSSVTKRESGTGALSRTDASTEEAEAARGTEETAEKENEGVADAAELPIYIVDSLETTKIEDHFSIEDYYCTKRVVSGNCFYIDEEHVLWGYGNNENGQLGIANKNGSETYYEEPVKIAENVVAVDGSWLFCIYLDEEGRLYGMGNNLLGLLRQPYEQRYSDNDYAKVFEPVLLMEDVAYASAGMKSIAALKKDGSVWWWGEYKSHYMTYEEDYRHELYWQSEADENNSTKMLYNHPTKLLENCVYAVTGNWTGAAITADGELYTWGRNVFGECGTETTRDDYVRSPQKVLDDVHMVWIEKIERGNPEAELVDRHEDHTEYDFTIFAQLKDGTILASGKDLGEKKKTIEVTGDMINTSTEFYADEFVPIALKEYSEAECRETLGKLEWGMAVKEADELLSQEGLYCMEILGPKEGSENELVVKELYVEDENYILRFDEEQRLYQILLQTGGSRNGQFSMGMSQSEVSALLDCSLLCEPMENGEGSVYWTEKPLDGSYLGFIFDENSTPMLRAVLEAYPSTSPIAP